MSNMVVGRNMRPAIRPQRIDCGLRNTDHIEVPTLFSQLCWAEACCDGRGVGGMKTKSSPAMATPASPIANQNVFQETPPAVIGPTTNCPADPPAMPNICVAPMRVAARDAGKYVVAR